MNTKELDPKTMAADLLLLSKDEVSVKCQELKLAPTDSKLKMIDQNIVTVFGLDVCKGAFARRC